MSRIVTLVLALGFAVVGVAGAASAHQGNIKVSSAVCVDADTMTATYTVVWENGTDSGVLSQKPGLLNSASPWTVVKNVTGQAGSATFQITHEKSSFTDANAANGPWQSARIVFSDNYKIEYDTRVEGFDWSKCLTPINVPAKPGITDPCGPNNAAYLPQTDTAQVDWTLNSDGSLNVKPKPPYKFNGASQSVTYPAPTDSNVPCPVVVPSVPVIDDCGPGNASYGTVPAGQWTSVVNPDGSLTITANPGYSFPNGQQSVTLPVPTDSNVACPTPPVVTPPVVTPPVVVPPEVLPAQVLVVKAGARRIDKCGRQGDLFKVAKKSGVIYTAKGKVLRQGVWLKARTRTVTVRASAADATYRLRGKSTWKLSFTSKSCAQAPEVAPNTGS